MDEPGTAEQQPKESQLAVGDPELPSLPRDLDDHVTEEGELEDAETNPSNTLKLPELRSKKRTVSSRNKPGRAA